MICKPGHDSATADHRPRSEKDVADRRHHRRGSSASALTLFRRRCTRRSLAGRDAPHGTVAFPHRLRSGCRCRHQGPGAHRQGLRRRLPIVTERDHQLRTIERTTPVLAVASVAAARLLWGPRGMAAAGAGAALSVANFWVNTSRSISDLTVGGGPAAVWWSDFVTTRDVTTLGKGRPGTGHPVRAGIQATVARRVRGDTLGRTAQRQEGQTHRHRKCSHVMTGMYQLTAIGE